MANPMDEVAGYYGVSTLPKQLDTGTAQTAQEQILEDATPLSEKLRAMTDVVKNTSWLQQWANQTFDMEGNTYEPEEEFELDAAGINDMLHSRGLSDGYDNFKKVAKARSASQLTDILDELEITQFETEHANQVLTDMQLKGTIVGTEVFSPENVLGVGLGIGLGIKTVKGALGLTGTLETVSAAGRIEIGEYKDWEEALPWLALGVVPELAIIHGINKFEASKLSEKLVNTPSPTQVNNSQMTNEQGQFLLAMPSEERLKVIARTEAAAKEKQRIFEASAASAKRQAEADAPKVVDKPFMQWNKEQQRAYQESEDFKALSEAEQQEYIKLLKEEEVRYDTKLNTQIDEVENIRASELKAIDDEIKVTTDTTKIDELELKKSEINKTVDEDLVEIKNGNKLEDKDLSGFTKNRIEVAKREAEEVAIDLRNEVELEDMLVKFETNPKYETSTVKSILRNMQKQVKDATLIAKKSLKNSKKIDEIKNTIKVLEVKIANIRKKALDAGRDLTRGEKGAITKLRNKLKIEQPKLSSSLDARKSKIEAREINRLTRMIGETFDDTTEAITALTKHVKGLSAEEALEFKQSVDLLSKSNPNFKALQTDIANIIKTKKVPKTFSVKNLSKKQKAMVIGTAIILADSANAADSDSEPLFGIGLGQAVMLIALAAGIKSAVSTFKGNGTLKEAVATKTKNMRRAFDFSESSTTSSGTRVNQMKDEILDKVSSVGLFDIYASLAKYGGDIKKYADEMLFSFEHGKYSVELEAAHLADSATTKVYNQFNNSFKSWLNEKGITKVKTILEHDKLLKTFDEEVATALETGKGSKFVMEVVNVMKREHDIMSEKMIDAKVLGAKSAQKIEGYFSRMWKHDGIQKLFRMNPKNKEILAKAIKKSLIDKGNTRLDAIDDNVDSLINSFEKTFDNTRGRNPSEIFSKIEDLLEEGVDSKTIEARLAKYADRNNRLKGRLDFDVKDLDGLKLVDGNGDEFILDLTNIVDRSSLAVFTKNAHNNYSHIAMGKRGFPSRSSAMKHIDTITKNNPEAKRDLEDITNMVYGRRINNESEGANKVTNALVAFNIVANLGAVAFSTTVEALLTIALRNPIKGFMNSIKVGTGNKNDFLVTIQDKVPLGVSNIINKGNVRGFETNDATEAFDAKSILESGAHKAKMATIAYSGLSKISDFLQKVNLVTHTEMLAEFLQTGKGLSKNRLNGYGINDDTIALLQNKFEFKNGNVQTPNFDKWTEAEVEAYANIMRRMNEEVTLTRTIGGSGLWQVRSNVGKLASSMLGYSTQLVSKQLVRGLKAMDMQTAKTTLLTVMGAYAGLYMRSQVEGKNYTDEQLMTYALLNAPIAQPYSILMGVANPSITQTTTDITNAMKIQ